MAKWVSVLAFGLLISCGGSHTLRESIDSSALLPDFRITKIEYQRENRQQLLRRSTRDPTTAKLEYRFTLLIENVGNAPIAEPFYLSVSGSLEDFQDFRYSRHIRLNDERRSLDAGQVLPFVVTLSLDFPAANARMSHYPVRFYINTEGPDNSAGYPTFYIQERNRQNNVYEIHIRL